MTLSLDRADVLRERTNVSPRDGSRLSSEITKESIQIITSKSSKQQETTPLGTDQDSYLYCSDIFQTTTAPYNHPDRGDGHIRRPEPGTPASPKDQEASDLGIDEQQRLRREEMDRKKLMEDALTSDKALNKLLTNFLMGGSTNEGQNAFLALDDYLMERGKSLRINRRESDNIQLTLYNYDGRGALKQFEPKRKLALGNPPSTADIELLRELLELKPKPDQGHER